MEKAPPKRRGLIGWLAARSRRFWGVVLLLPVLYVASFGPACWLISYVGVGIARPNPPIRAVDWISMAYVPVGQMALHGPDFVAQSLAWYATLGVPDDKPALIPIRLHHWIVCREPDDSQE